MVGVDCPWLIFSTSKIESVAGTANGLALDVQSLQRESIECNSLLMNLLGVTALSIPVSSGEVKLGVMPPTSLYHINDSDHFDLIPYQIFLHTSLCGAPPKCFQSGPALAKAGPAKQGKNAAWQLLETWSTIKWKCRVREMQQFCKRYRLSLLYNVSL